MDNKAIVELDYKLAMLADKYNEVCALNEDMHKRLEAAVSRADMAGQERDELQVQLDNAVKAGNIALHVLDQFNGCSFSRRQIQRLLGITPAVPLSLEHIRDNAQMVRLLPVGDGE